MKTQIGSNKPRQEATNNICKVCKLGRASVIRIGGSQTWICAGVERGVVSKKLRR